MPTLPGHLVIWLTPPLLWTQGQSCYLVQVSSLRTLYEPTEHAYDGGRRKEGMGEGGIGEGGREGGEVVNSLDSHLTQCLPNSPDHLPQSTDAIPARVLLIDGVSPQRGAKSPTAPLPGMPLPEHRETLAPKVCRTLTRL